MTTNTSTTAFNEPENGRFTTLHKAIQYAVLWHTGQDRKYSQLPYIVHPLRVMQIVRSVTDDEDMLIAAVLHDVVEDTDIELSTIDSLFGSRVAELVDWLTDVSKPEDGNREARKNIDMEHSAAAPADAQTIKLADVIDNSRSITRDNPNFARIYMKEKERLLAALTRGDARLQAEVQTIIEQHQDSLLQDALKPG